MMALMRISDLDRNARLEDALTLCFEACGCEIVGFRASFTNLQLWFLEVFPLFILLFRTRTHSSSG